jgi:hypothetical protein
MFAFVRVLFFGTLSLLVLIPIGIMLAAIGLPALAIVGALAVPILVVLFLVGLPLLIMLAVGGGLLAATFGVIVAFLSLGAVVFKVAVIVLVPLMLLGWMLRNRGSGLGIRDSAAQQARGSDAAMTIR